jgi:carboxyl-terminal processing protease
MKKFLLLGIISVALFASCKKNRSDNSSNGSRTRDQLVKDSAFSYAKEIFLWYDQLPATLNTDGFSNPDAIMRHIRQFSRETGFTNPVDRFSFGALKKDWDNVSSGVAADFGMRVFFRTVNDLRVSSVDSKGPAGIAGIKRGWRISSINGVAINDTSQSNFILNTVYAAPTTRFNFTLPDNSTRELTLNSQIFTGDPFAVDSVYTYGANRIGYFVMNSFLGDTNKVRQDIDRIFARFSSAGITDLVVDLRYNGGGYVLLARYLLDHLVPSAGNGQVMFTNQFNNKYAQFNSTVSFAKKGSVNLNRIFFIVSRQSASASELTINSIKPVMDVKIVGPSATNGKPVGFFDIPVGDWYIFPVSFRTINRNNEANYYNGFIPDYTSPDGLDKNWGDVDEACLSRAIRFITTGSWARVAPVDGKLIDEQLQLRRVNAQIDATHFSGMIGTGYKFR